MEVIIPVESIACVILKVNQHCELIVYAVCVLKLEIKICVYIYIQGKGGENNGEKDKNKMANVQENVCIGINLSKHFLSPPRCQAPIIAVPPIFMLGNPYIYQPETSNSPSCGDSLKQFVRF